MPKNIKSFFVVSPNIIGEVKLLEGFEGFEGFEGLFKVEGFKGVVAPCSVVAAVTADAAALGFLLNRSTKKSTITTNKQGMYKTVLKINRNNGLFEK